MAFETQSYRYCVDADDLLIEVDALWLAFARENGAAELTAASVLGRSLWDFMEGAAIRAVYEVIHKRVRSSGKSAAFPFRCDSPTLKRYMRMTITCAKADQLTYESHILRVEPQRLQVVLDANQQRSESFLTICSCCKKAMLESVGWLEIEDLALAVGILESDNIPQLCHSICPDCFKTMSSSVDNSTAA